MILKADVVFNEILKKLKTEFNPTKIYLFGSRALNSNRLDSDFDIVLVVPTTTRTRVQNIIKTQELLWNLDANVDVFVYSEDEFNQLKNDFSSIPEIAVRTGREISLA
jgi:predicted nucleotidyltransferase